jgi:hypothetical protein
VDINVQRDWAITVFAYKVFYFTLRIWSVFVCKTDDTRRREKGVCGFGAVNVYDDVDRTLIYYALLPSRIDVLCWEGRGRGGGKG